MNYSSLLLLVCLIYVFVNLLTICHTELYFPDLQINSTFNVLIDHRDHLYPIQPPIIFRNKDLFLNQLEETLANVFPSVIHQENHLNNDQLTTKITLVNPYHLPHALVWVPTGQEPQKTFFYGNCKNLIRNIDRTYEQVKNPSI